MNKSLLILLLILILVMTGSHSKIFAPELFSLGQGLGLQILGYEILLISVHWTPDTNFLFLMYGRQQGASFKGQITQILGEQIKSYPPYDCSTSTIFCYERSLYNNWQGWIEFRGHKRPFCGGQKIKAVCMKVTF